MNRRGFVATLLSVGKAAQSPFAFEPLSADSLQLNESGKPVLAYNHGMVLKPGVPADRRRSTYLHPVYAPDGTVLTDDFPADHYHHRGISWMWPVVRIGEEQYDLWGIRGIRQQFVRWTRRDTAPRAAYLGVENGWFVQKQRVLNEQVEIRVGRAASTRRRLDFTLTFEALDRPIQISGSPEEQKGYGGFCARFAPRQETLLYTDGGREPHDSNLTPHPWAQLRGKFGRRWGGIRIDIDPSNPGFPNGWTLRHYGFLGVAFPGLGFHSLQPGRQLVLRYAVKVFSGQGGILTSNPPVVRK